MADHQPPPARVASLLVSVHILGHLDLQGCHQHPPSTLPGQVVQRRSRGRFFRFRRRVEYLQHGWRLLSPACQPASHVDYAKGYAAFFTLPIHNFGLYLPTRFLHDCRRTAARNLIRASVPERVAMLLTGHKTRAIFDRYNIINEQELLEAGDQLVAYLAQHAQATPRGGRPHPARTAAPRTAPPLRLVRRTTA